MRIAILSRNHSLYSTRRLAQAARARGHEVRVVDTLAVAVEVGLPMQPEARAKLIAQAGAGVSRVLRLPQLDAIIPRIGASVTFYGLAVVRQFEAQGLLTTATADAIARSRDKLQSLQAMSEANLPIPKTAVIARKTALFPAIRAVGGLPVVIKLIRGTQGRGVVLARNLATAAAVLEKVRAVKRQALVQEYIAEAEGKDVRVIVVGGRCVAAMQRTAPQGDFRANLHRGGKATAVELDRETQKLAVAAAQAHNLAVAGVDLIHSRRGPLLLEVNSSPGLKGIETATQQDVASEIINYLEKAARRRRNGR